MTDLQTALDILLAAEREASEGRQEDCRASMLVASDAMQDAGCPNLADWCRKLATDPDPRVFSRWILRLDVQDRAEGREAGDWRPPS